LKKSESFLPRRFPIPFVEEFIYIEGPAKAVYELGKKMEDFPQFMPDVEKVEILKREGSRAISEWTTSVEGAPIVLTEEDLFDDSKLLITYRLIVGDLDKFEGTWRFLPEGNGTKVTLGVDFDFGMPALTELIGPTLELKVRENSRMMLEAMKTNIEGAAKVNV
jgi:ribosome-associated toxin RatA of RatAB toxin-antitoxin module